MTSPTVPTKSRKIATGKRPALHFLFVRGEDHRSFWDWLTQDDAHVEYKDVLYRIRLPD